MVAKRIKKAGAFSPRLDYAYYEVLVLENLVAANLFNRSKLC